MGHSPEGHKESDVTEETEHISFSNNVMPTFLFGLTAQLAGISVPQPGIEARLWQLTLRDYQIFLVILRKVRCLVWSTCHRVTTSSPQQMVQYIKDSALASLASRLAPVAAATLASRSPECWVHEQPQSLLPQPICSCAYCASTGMSYDTS